MRTSFLTRRVLDEADAAAAPPAAGAAEAPEGDAAEAGAQAAPKKWKEAEEPLLLAEPFLPAQGGAELLSALGTAPIHEGGEGESEGEGEGSRVQQEETPRGEAALSAADFAGAVTPTRAEGGDDPGKSEGGNAEAMQGGFPAPAVGLPSPPPPLRNLRRSISDNAAAVEPAAGARGGRGENEARSAATSPLASLDNSSAAARSYRQSLLAGDGVGALGARAGGGLLGASSPSGFVSPSAPSSGEAGFGAAGHPSAPAAVTHPRPAFKP